MAVIAVLLFSAGARSQDASSAAASDSPYASIVARNMFGLLPIPKVDPNANQPPPDPPPKITLNGIMTIFGKDQALFKVANKPKPGQPAKEDAHVLAEGEMEDDITVVSIDHLNGKVTFNNHGETQELALVAAKESGGPAPAPGGIPGRTMPGGFPQPGFVPGGGRPGMGAFQRPPMPNSPGYGGNTGNPNPLVGTGGVGQGTAGFPNGVSLSGGTTVNEKGIYQPADESGVTPEENAILMEAQRNQYLQNGNSRLANLLPPTKYTEQLNPKGQQ
jgi:hypothetical protein